jgi:hypothetical protein
MQDQELRALYQQFMDQNVQTFAGGRFQIAYHALAAAMHCAEALRDGSLLLDVQRSAEEQGNWIDIHAPDNRLSSLSAKTRGNESIFVTLTKHVHAIQVGLHAEAQQEHARWL